MHNAEEQRFEGISLTSKSSLLLSCINWFYQNVFDIEVFFLIFIFIYFLHFVQLNEKTHPDASAP